MINFKETFFPHFKDFCIETFGTDKGMQLFEKSELKLNELIGENDDGNNKYIRWHLHKNMLPVISIYLIFKEFNIIRENALQYTDEIMQISRLKMKKKNQLLGKLPFGYILFKTFSRDIVSKQYPEKGWNVK